MSNQLPFTQPLITRGCNLSDFHELAISLNTKKDRSPNKNRAYMIDNGGRRLGIERREYAYSHYYPERRVGADRRIHPERRTDASKDL
jgi:hypothetical protein